MRNLRAASIVVPPIAPIMPLPESDNNYEQKEFGKNRNDLNWQVIPVRSGLMA